MRIRKSLQDSADGYLWEDHWTRISKRIYAAKVYGETYKSRLRHVVRKPNQPNAVLKLRAG